VEERPLRDVRQHRVSAAESHHRRFDEEEAFLEKRVIGA
jgi:hypothetical protein